MTQEKSLKEESGVLGIYVQDPVGMDHPIFMAKMQAAIDAQFAAQQGLPIAKAIVSITARMRDLFGDVPSALVAAQVSIVYASIVAASLPGSEL